MKRIPSGRVHPAAIAAAGLLLAAALAAPAGVTFAAPAPRDSPEARQACMPEVFRVCNQYVPDVGQITACLQKNRSILKADCRRFIAGGEVHRRALRHRVRKL